MFKISSNKKIKIQKYQLSSIMTMKMHSKSLKLFKVSSSNKRDQILSCSLAKLKDH